MVLEWVDIFANHTAITEILNAEVAKYHYSYFVRKLHIKERYCIDFILEGRKE